MAPRKKTAELTKAYDNIEFLNSPAARTLRILSEMLEPADRFHRYKIRNTVAFFGSARTLSKQEATKQLKIIDQKIAKTKNPSKALLEEQTHATRLVKMSRYYEDAVCLSEKLSLWFKSPEMKKLNCMICSGGGPGIMEAANRGAYNAKCNSLGMNISLPMEQHPNPYQTKELSFEFHYFFIRKFWFAYLAQALVVFPGGFGTLDELFEIITLIQTKKIKKRLPIILYGSEFWNDLLNFDTLVKWGTINKNDLKLFKIIDNVDEAFEYLQKELLKTTESEVVKEEFVKEILSFIGF